MLESLQGLHRIDLGDRDEVPPGGGLDERLEVAPQGGVQIDGALAAAARTPDPAAAQGSRGRPAEFAQAAPDGRRRSTRRTGHRRLATPSRGDGLGPQEEPS